MVRLYTTSVGVAREEPDGSLAVLDVPVSDIGDLLRSGAATTAGSAMVRGRVDRSEATILSPVLAPRRFVIVGLNYRSHVDEFSEGMGIEPNYDVGKPFVTELPGDCVCGPGDPIVRPSEAPDKVDYEGEIGLVVGTTMSEVAPGEAWSHIAGLTVVNDVSARDVQTRAMRATPPGIGGSKSFPTFKPLGPCMTTTDEYDAGADGSGLDVGVVTRVNGEQRQDGRTTEFLTPLPDLLAFISRRVTLEPGDVICTGSPRGVGMWTGGIFLASGDLVDIEVEGVGVLSNPVT